MIGSYLKYDELWRIHELIISAKRTSAADINALIGNMDSQYNASLPSEGVPTVRILNILVQLNQTGELTTGELPLRTFLYNATAITKPLQESARLREFVEKLERRFAWRKLAELIESCGLEDDELRGFFHLCLPQRSIRPPLWKSKNIYAMAEHLGEAKHATRGDAFSALLFAYLIVQRTPDDGIAETLQQWIEDTIRVLGLHCKLESLESHAKEIIDKSQANASGEVDKSDKVGDDFEQARLMVMVTPTTADGQYIEVTMFWCRRGEKPKVCSDAPGKVNNLSQLSNVIQQGLDSHILDTPIHVTIEIFLPYYLMDYNLEFPSDPGEVDTSFLVHHQVMRRFAERQAIHNIKRIDNKKTRELVQSMVYWKEKSNRFLDHQHKIKQLHKWIKSDELNNEASLYTNLIITPDVCCTSPSFAPKERLAQLLYQNLRSGVPACFWSGNGEINLEAEFDGCLSHFGKEFLMQMRELQAQGLGSSDKLHKGKLLFLLWDDAERPFPDN